MDLSNQNAIDPCILSRFSINDFVTHHVRIFQINMILFNEFLDHLSRRFAAMTLFIWGMWANGKIFEWMEFVFTKIILKLAVDNINCFKGKIASTNTGLIGHYEKFISHVLE